MEKSILTLFIFALFGFNFVASACPNIESLIDYNCDRKIKVAFTGDSITYGRGDFIHGDKGGFVIRLREEFPTRDISFTNIGVPGFTSTQLLRGFKRHLNQQHIGATIKRTRNTDVIIIKVGVNDWWDNVTPVQVVTKIKRLVSYLRKKVPEISESQKAPFIAISTLIPAKRPSQYVFVQEINQLLLKLKSNKLPVYIRSENFPIELIDDSTVHPTPKGYKYLTNVMKDFLVNLLPSIIEEKKLLPDRDKDGVYDYYETNKFGTNPRKKDTDGDGFSDGEELFELNSDPLSPDSPANKPENTEV